MGNKIWNKIGNNNEALAIYLIAHENVENKKTLDSLAWYIENEISSFYTMKGDYEKAEYFSNLLRESLSHYKMNKFLSRYYTNLGRKLKSEFRVEEAKTAFKSGYNLADSIDYPLGVFANAFNLVELFNDYPDLGSSELYLQRATKLLPALTADIRYLEKKSWLEIETARYLSRQGRYAESLPIYKQAIQALSQYYSTNTRREFAKLFTALAATYVQLDSLTVAEKTINQGFSSLIAEFKETDELPATNQLYAENSFIKLLELKARVYESQFYLTQDKKLLEKNLICIDLALHVNDLIRETVIADPSKLVSISSNKKLIGRGISILYLLYSEDPSERYLKKARSFFDRSKSLLYAEKSRLNSLGEIISIVDKEKWSQLQRKILELYDRKFEKDADINAINGEFLTCEEQIDKIFSAYDQVLLKEQEPENYIEYFMAEKEIYAFAELNDQTVFIKIGLQQDFQDLADRLNEFIYLKGKSLDDNILNELYSFLVRPLTVQLPPDLVIIPDGSIGYVPFEMLKDDLGNYLIENSTISYSFEYSTSTNDVAHTEKELDIYCLVPQYKVKEVSGKEVTRGSIYHLPYAKLEVDSISNLYGSSALTSQSGDKDDLQQRLEDTRVFHYAGHAIIQGDNAYLALSDIDDEKQQLTGKEISLMHHPLDLVVLSACETGLGKMEHGEGIRSLGKSFMESGAKATVISLWNVNDKSTALIMTGFYKYLREGMRKDEALRQSKLNYLKTITSRNLHPYFWAAFIPAGDMNPLE